MNEDALVASGVVEICRVDVRQRLPDGNTDFSEDALRWEEAAEEASLKSGEIQLWRGWLDRGESTVETCRSWLSDDEQERASRFHFERDRMHYILARGWLRQILGWYLRTEPGEIHFRYGAAGKPELDSPPDSGIHFNLSHSGGMALYAFSRETEVGVDVERVRVVAEAEAIMTRHFSNGEVERWRTLSVAEQPADFLRCWVEAEARAKRTGRGLAAVLGGDDALACGGQMRVFVPMPGYVGALAWREKNQGKNGKVGKGDPSFMPAQIFRHRTVAALARFLGNDQTKVLSNGAPSPIRRADRSAFRRPV